MTSGIEYTLPTIAEELMSFPTLQEQKNGSDELPFFA
jgi:hypothetical protein